MKIIGHERQQNILDTHIRRGRVSHAYLFSGAAHVGKARIADAFVISLLCAKRPEGILASCGVCVGCRAVQSGSHPDIITLTSITKEKSRPHISVDAIRSLRARMGQAALLGSYKIAIIDDASYLGREAANAILKTLEEPTGSTVYLLIASKRETILPTIMSRVWSMAFWPVSSTALEEQAKGYGWNAADAYTLSMLAEGRPGSMDVFRDGDMVALKTAKEEATRRLLTWASDSLAQQLSEVEERITHERTDDIWYTSGIGALMHVLERRLLNTKTPDAVLGAIPTPRIAEWIRNSLEEQADLGIPYVQKKMRMEAATLSNHIS